MAANDRNMQHVRKILIKWLYRHSSLTGSVELLCWTDKCTTWKEETYHKSMQNLRMKIIC
jgi:hypothetical protein